VISNENVRTLEAAEAAEAERLGLEDFKMKTNQEMLDAIN